MPSYDFGDKSSKEKKKLFQLEDELAALEEPLEEWKGAGFVVDAATQAPRLAMTPEAVARAGYQACMTGRVIEVPGLGNAMASQWVRFQPRWLVRGVTGLLGRRLFRPG